MEVTDKTRNRMSKLGTPEPAPSPAVGGLTDEVIIEHLKACQATLVDHAGERFTAFAKELDAQLVEYAEGAKTNQEQVDLAEEQRLLRQQFPELERYFL